MHRICVCAVITFQSIYFIKAVCVCVCFRMTHCLVTPKVHLNFMLPIIMFFPPPDFLIKGGMALGCPHSTQVYLMMAGAASGTKGIYPLIKTSPIAFYCMAPTRDVQQQPPGHPLPPNRLDKSFIRLTQ